MKKGHFWVLTIVRIPRLKGWARSGERSIRRGAAEIDAIRRSTIEGIITESRGGKGRIHGK
jgi:hypothetical protein